MVLCLAIEAATFSLTTVWASASAFILIFLSFVPLPFVWQVVLFFILTIIMLVFTRPFAVKKLKVGRFSTNVNSLVGQKVLVTKRITEFEKGEVKSSGGVIWSAACDGVGEFPKGAVCEVVCVEGNTLFVKES